DEPSLVRSEEPRRLVLSQTRPEVSGISNEDTPVWFSGDGEADQDHFLPSAGCKPVLDEFTPDLTRGRIRVRAEDAPAAREHAKHPEDAATLVDTRRPLHHSPGEPGAPEDFHWPGRELREPTDCTARAWSDVLGPDATARPLSRESGAVERSGRIDRSV